MEPARVSSTNPFIIRLEDTDQTRFVHDAESRLYQDMQWAGLTWAEGPDKGGPFGPYKQSERLELYRNHVDVLLEKDRAFRCFCTKEDLEFNLQQATSSGATAHYPGTCMGISKSESDRRAANGEPHVVRFKTSDVPVSAPDLVYGAYKKAEREDNFIIMKSDGFPTYHFANVVDDHFMEITHVIRGAEWLISTPKHVELYNAFGWQPPNFAHVGLLVDHQRQKLSKRDIDNIGISVFRDNNIMPETLLNFSVLLGWDPSLQNRPHLDKRGRMTLEEMKQNFTRGDIVVDLAKLKFFQSRFTRELISGDIPDPITLSNRILKPIQSELERLKQDLSKGSVSEAVAEVVGDKPEKRIDMKRQPEELTEKYIHEVLKASKGPVGNHRQFISDNLYAFWPPSTPAYKSSFMELQTGMNRIKMMQKTKKILNMDISKVLLQLRNLLDELSEDKWTLENVGTKAKELADSVTYYNTEKDHIMDNGAGWKFLRWGLLVGMPGLSVVPVMVLLGREESLRRLRVARKAAADEEGKLAAEASRAAKQRKRELLQARYMGGPTDGYRETPEEKVSEPRNVKIRLHEDESTFTPKKAEKFLRPIHPESSVPELGPFVSQPPPERVPDQDKKRRPPSQFISPKAFKDGYYRLSDGRQSDSPHAPPSEKRIEKRPRTQPASDSWPAVEEGAFGKEASVSRPESLNTRTATHHPTDRPGQMSRPRPTENKRVPPIHVENEDFPPVPFQTRMSADEVEAHLKSLMALQNETRMRQALNSVPNRLKRPTRGDIPSDIRDTAGPFYCGEPVPHPLRSQAHSARVGAGMAEVEQKLGRSWAKPGDSNGTKKPNGSQQ
ncbi:hypothetical protein J7T55_007538 [Diaporthe amygdali]|uniref:uncharacterized protein n=1 Tax=Phomopsis amygdali TaxID=1214568 RepID=UPI0022FEE6D6|nr:uncharacterized protein J7T55_007538 [Diaporthe amygdali]KAJ0116558.1 hypothetical protein J7T55_007538 [Diaporthe amygdali]